MCGDTFIAMMRINYRKTPVLAVKFLSYALIEKGRGHMAASLRVCGVRSLGRISYAAGLALQQSLAEKYKNNFGKVF